MPSLRSETNPRSPIKVISDWWRGWTRSRSDASELACCAEGEVARMAGDLGVSADELRTLARRGPASANLLLRRLAALDLDGDEIAKADRSTFLDLQRVCAMCQVKRQCSRDLSHDPTDTAWEDYCPNVATLKMLNALPWASRREW